ncbi:potassium-transporting ATPase subunit KdpA [Acidihalobacter aeolianus]|uniref:Potassium-transporting ATPase potassium-binding subunit n=1 Tax=Acidihalobacter aeolianus TaxID=2792603 RepID=A0A1D8K4U6_9GAMM|nr:potassium-transporting ATPase subunit KdpA [Acidihalobacter aeolianus]AOV15972.1 potassium-transporting ATPase subunit KdpA [Acidihalobacter aeolianus]
MTTGNWQLLAVYLVLLTALGWILSYWIEPVMAGRFSWLRQVESPLFRLIGLRTQESHGWLHYTTGLLLFNVLGVFTTYGILRLQNVLPLNPAHLPAVPPGLAFDTAVSFVTNTNWQNYGGETTMSYLAQMSALTTQNFFSAATGLVIAISLIRAMSGESVRHLGNVWIDLARAVLWILIPLSLIFSLALVGQGVIQNLSGYRQVHTLQSTQFSPKIGEVVHSAAAPSNQTIAMGPVASQEAIKLLGTNGGGFFNVNSAHPYENPTALSNFMEMLAIPLISVALVFAFGRMVGDRRQAWALYGAMVVLFLIFTIPTMLFEQQGNPLLTQLHVNQQASALQSGGNMEGKEVRFGPGASALFDTAATATSCGAVNSMLDSYTPLGGAGPLALMQLGEVVFGGVGSGLYGILIYALLAVFVAGLMIGRSPEYLGKKIETFEIKMVSIAILISPLLALLGTALAVLTHAGRSAPLNPGAHGFTEILYALTSAANNNGSAFAGLSADTVFYNVLLGIVMWFGRFGVIVPVLAIAGSLAEKRRLQSGVGTLPTHGPLFAALLVGFILMVGLLNFVPADALGPLAEQFSIASR